MLDRKKTDTYKMYTEERLYENVLRIFKRAYNEDN